MKDRQSFLKKTRLRRSPLHCMISFHRGPFNGFSNFPLFSLGCIFFLVLLCVFVSIVWLSADVVFTIYNKNCPNKPYVWVNKSLILFPFSFELTERRRERAIEFKQVIKTVLQLQTSLNTISSIELNCNDQLDIIF